MQIQLKLRVLEEVSMNLSGINLNLEIKLYHYVLVVTPYAKNVRGTEAGTVRPMAMVLFCGGSHITAVFVFHAVTSQK